MGSKILSLNVGTPAPLTWRDKTIVTSMIRHPLTGPLVVHKDHIEGDRFSQPDLHGTLDTILYLLGVTSITNYVQTMGHQQYTPGLIGENVTLDSFDEDEISIGDIFRIGEVVIQAASPRFPCEKLNLLFESDEAKRQMELGGRSGVYFRILEPGKIYQDSTVTLAEKAKVPFMVPDFFKMIASKRMITSEEYEKVLANGAFPQRWVNLWRVRLNEFASATVNP